MSDKSGIAWTDATWNVATGCTKVSPGCKFCYAKHRAWPRLSAMKTGVYAGRKFEDVRVHPERLDQPLRWTKPRRIFVNSMSDLFHEDIPFGFIAAVFGVMAAADKHTFQVLTKRPERMRDFMLGGATNAYAVGWCKRFAYQMIGGEMGKRLEDRSIDPMWPPKNVWLGVSVENQETANERIPLLVDTPAAVRWLSCEPLLGPIDLCHRNLLDWVVVGGESGPKARPMEEAWALDLREQCRSYDVPFFIKQGSQANWPDWKDMSKWPEPLQVREYPKQ